MAKTTFLSYNVASSSSLSGLNMLLNIFQPTIAFLQEITLTTDQLNGVVGSRYSGVSNIDPMDPRKPGNAVIWSHNINDITVINTLVL